MGLGGEAPRSFELLHIEANAGASSGGHAAVCFPDACFHFEQGGSATIRIQKEDPQRLDFVYRAIGNRTVHAQRVTVSAETYILLREAFASYHRVQSRQFEAREALERERRLLAGEFARRRDRSGSAPTALRVPASAYFLAGGDLPSPRAAANGAVAGVARAVRAAHGAGCLDERVAALRSEIARLRPPELGPEPPAAATLPRPWMGMADRAEELLSGLLAVEVLRTAPALRPGAIRAPEGEAFRLRPAELSALAGHAARLQASLVRLFGSERSDWGYPMLVGLARLAAVEESIDRGRLVLLDVFREDAATVAAPEVARHTGALRLVRDERAQDFESARARFFGARSPSETDWSMLETAGNLLAEIERALGRDATGRTQAIPAALRVHQSAPVPARSAVRADWQLPRLSDGDLERALRVAEKRAETYDAALRALYPYDVVRRNCVTEIFRTIDAALAPSAATPAATDDLENASRDRLGGRVRLDGSLNFIPFMAARAVAATYRVEAEEIRPSYRRLALARMKAKESPLLVALRESNVATATAYQPGDDPAFLFFTEDWPFARPVLGAANLAYGAGTVLAGAAFLPVDGGRLLRSGFEGAVFSLPELLFVNIRKGSFPFAPRSCLDPAPATVSRETPHRRHGSS